MGMIEKLIYARRTPVIGRVIHEVLSLYGIEIPNSVDIGPGLDVQHRGQGIIMSPRCRIGSNVRIFHQVTLGTRTSPPGKSLPKIAIDIQDDVILYPGVKVVGGWEPTVIGRGAQIAPNTVITRSVGAGEVWAAPRAERIELSPLWSPGTA